MNLRQWLEEKQGDLVTSLQRAVAGFPEARPLSNSQASALVLALGVASKQGPSVLENLLVEWSEEGEMEAAGGGRWAATMMAVREAMWANLIAEFSPAKALTHLKVLENLLVRSAVLAAALEHQGTRPAPDQERRAQ